MCTGRFGNGGGLGMCGGEFVSGGFCVLFCYVRQCSLFVYLMLSSLYEMCLRVLHYISLYALSLHSTLACLWVPFLHVLGRIRELALHDVINSNCYYI